MPKKGKKGGKKKGGGSRSVNQRPMNMRMIPATWNMNVLDSRPLPTPKKEMICTFRRTFTLQKVTANTGDTNYAYVFRLSDIPNYTDYTNLFDQYRLLEVIVSFAPYFTGNPTTNVSADYAGIIGHWIDYDDASLPGNLAEGQQYDSYQRNNCTEPFQRVVKPKSVQAAYAGVTPIGAYDSVYGQWHDCSNAAITNNSHKIEHYGLKYCITGSSFTQSTPIYEIEGTYTFQFKSQH